MWRNGEVRNRPLLPMLESGAPLHDLETCFQDWQGQYSINHWESQVGFSLKVYFKR